MSDAPPRPERQLAVIGGGVTGLAAAHRLRQLLPRARLNLFEAGPRVGGPLDTRTSGEVLLEQGADSFLTREPWAVDLCRELGIADELVPTSVEHRRALVVCRGTLERVPEGFVLMQPHDIRAVLRSPVLSLAGKLRLLAEPLVRQRTAEGAGDDESVASFATRRLGREVFERLVEPLLGGIYVADATRLSLAATMPEFLAAERDHGSLQKARAATRAVAPRGSSGARYGAFVTLRRGLSSMIDALVAALPPGCVCLNSAISGLARSSGAGWILTTVTGESHACDGVVVAAPAQRAAALIESVDPPLAALLARITAASSAVATLVYRREQIARPLDAFGFVVPRTEGRRILAASFSSVKFAGRAPADLVPVRVFLGGARQSDLLGLDDNSLVAIAAEELAALVGARGEPQSALVARWPAAMPQYHVGHLDLVAAIEQRAAAHRGLELAGASYRGVGIPQCVFSGRSAAERLAADLASSR